MVRVSDNPNIEEDEPEALFTGLHHAREPMSYMNLFYFMNWLTEGDGDGTRGGKPGCRIIRADRCYIRSGTVLFF